MTTFKAEESVLSKRALRKEILNKRDQMDPQQRSKESEWIRRQVTKLSAFAEAKKVLLFASYGSEAITDGIIEDALSMNKQVYLPTIVGEEMEFFGITSLEELALGYKGIREPAPIQERRFEIAEEKREQASFFLLLPGVVFDTQGNRIGYGKGFYDRFLMRTKDVKREIYAIALSCQIVENGRITPEPHDQKITNLIAAGIWQEQ